MKELTALAKHLANRRGPIMEAWRAAVRKDPSLTSGTSMPRAELNDHIPILLSSFEQALLRQSGQLMAAEGACTGKTPDGAAEHGLHRWQQGYDLREVIGELGRLNECLVAELDDYQNAHPGVGPEAMAAARRAWAALCTEGISASAAQYYRLQEVEARGHVNELENALEGIRELEHRRGELWQQAAHDLRGNLGVVATATAGLASPKVTISSQEGFLRLLQRNVATLHSLLDDVTSLARLQAGRETRHVASVDVANVFQELAEGLKEFAEQKNLYLHYSGPSPMVVEADEVKIRRVAQNLVLNAIKFTQTGGVSLDWGDSHDADDKRWAFLVKDTGPGYQAGPAATMAGALEAATTVGNGPDAAMKKAVAPARGANALREGSRDAHNSNLQVQGEGIGLSIVKRLCDLLDATLEIASEQSSGTTFRILLPRRYT